IHGAKGLMWYGGSVHGGIFADKATPEETHWEDLKKLARELHDLSPAFLSPTIEAPKFSPATAPISVCLKQSPTGLVLLAANRGADAVEIIFSVPQIKVGSAKVVSENRAVNVSAG